MIRRRGIPKYVIEIDGQDFVADTVEEIRELLKQAKETAPQAAREAARDTIKIKPPKITIKLGSGRQVQSQAINRELDQTRRMIRATYRKVVKEIQENQRIIEVKRKEREEEEAILKLLL